MIHRNLKSCLDDLERAKQLVRIDTPVDPYLEVGAIQRRVFQAQGPALLFTNVKGTRFPMAANIFGTLARTKYIFRSTLRRVEAMLSAKADPAGVLKKPKLWPGLALGGWHTLPKTVTGGPILARTTSISQLPQLVSWPMDGGAYVTLPLVYTESPSKPGFMGSNLGMYRIQLSGNEFEQDREVGLHYQIHRGIGYHHAEAIARGETLPVSVFVGGPPAMTLAAIMPLPEGIAEMLFAGALGGHRIPMIRRPGELPIPAEADFCIRGHIDPRVQKPEGPFAGAALTIFTLEETHEVAVVEMGTNHFGEIGRIAAFVQPDFCLFTNIGLAHVENFGSREGIFRGKTEMLQHMRPGGRVIVNGDDDLLCQIPGALRYGLHESCAVRATEIDDLILRGMRFTAHYEGRQCRMHVHALGVHSVYNALAAVAIGQLLGMELQQIAAGIETYKPLRGRMNVHELPRYTLIDDSYNANPTSMKSSLDVLVKCAGRRVAILGDMWELGEAGPQMHEDLGRYAASLGIERILCVGKESKRMYNGAQAASPGCAEYFETQEELLAALPERINDGDVILIKASRGMYLEKTVELLLA